jgi:hypothetical protein
MKKLIGFQALLLLPFSLTAFSQVVVAPSSVSGEGNQFSSFYPFGSSSFGATTQVILSASELNLNVGDSITGIAFRLNGGGTGTAPTSDASFTSFDVTLGQAANTPAGMDTTFANNFAPSTQVQVRSGPLTLSQNSFTQGATPNNFGPVISFTPYVYQGGALVLQINSSGSSTAIPGVDSNQGDNSTYNTQFGFSPSSTTGSQFATPIIQFSVTPVPEPATAALFGGLSLGAFAIIRRCRKNQL